MNNTLNSTTLGQAHRTVRGFSLVEVALAVAVVAIGVVGILALFPLGMDAVRKAADDTQMMAIGEDAIAYYQQMAANTNYYSVNNTAPFVCTNVIGAFYSESITQPVDGIWYISDATVTNTGFSQIFSVSNNPACAGLTNMTSRVQIAVYRVATNSVSKTVNRITNTVHYYFTEVDRYVQ